MNDREQYFTAGELSTQLPFSEEYIRAAMNHEEFETIGTRPAFATYDDALSFFKSHKNFRIDSVYRKRSGSVRSV